MQEPAIAEAAAAEEAAGAASMGWKSENYVWLLPSPHKEYKKAKKNQKNRSAYDEQSQNEGVEGEERHTAAAAAAAPIMLLCTAAAAAATLVVAWFRGLSISIRIVREYAPIPATPASSAERLWSVYWREGSLTHAPCS